MDDADVDARLAAGREGLTALGRALRDGGPWPLAERIDHSPEAEWGPRETLAHLAELLPYWLGEAERLIETDGPEPFGRDATNHVRLAIIERDRTLPIRELEARVVNGIDRWRARWTELDDAAKAKRGLHPTLGEMTVAELVDRFVARHLEDHLDQLASTLAADPGRA